MHTGSSIIIHGSVIIQHGLKSILLSGNIVIRDITITFPEIAVFSSWKNMFLFIDIQYADEIKKHGKILKKNGNKIIVIDTAGSLDQAGSEFDEIIYINDNSETILRKIGKYIPRGSSSKYDNQLSAREVEILTRIAQGFSNKLIADQLFLSIHTVITHRKNITSKLGIKSISGLTLYAALNNMIDSHS